MRMWYPQAHSGGLLAVNGKLRRFAAALLPICFVSAQKPQSPKQSSQLASDQPSPEALRHMFEVRHRMKEHSIAINDLAGQIHSLDDARKLVNLVAGEFSEACWLRPRRGRCRSVRAGRNAATAAIPQGHG
jgi:hypothetical protein